MTISSVSSRAWLAALLLWGASGLCLAATGRERSPAAYPPQFIPLRFDHAMHLKAGADCLSCHDSARKSPRAADWNLPKHPECETCHEIKAASMGKRVDPPSTCRTCHPGFDQTVHREPEKLEMPKPNVHFNHQVHVQKKVKCEVCHGVMAEVGLATRSQLPKMATCLECHDGKAASNACGSCHPTQPSGRLQLRFSSGLLRPLPGNPLGMDHGPRFEFTHGARASLAREMCMECHAESECQSCHDALQKPLSVHPNDYISIHPVQARQDSARCESCHRLQSFCAACHERVGVGFDADPAFRPSNAKVHPDYFVWVQNRGPHHHAIAAARDIKQCASCHREESCLPCHSDAERFGVVRVVNPHPQGFDLACKGLAAKNDRPCLKCHTEARLQELGCR